MRALALSLAACVALVSCSGGKRPAIDSESDLARYPRTVFREAGLDARYRDATHLHYTVQHGTQIAHTATDGRVYLWYPGNASVVVGSWKTTTDETGYGRICFRYPSSSYNPATGSFGGNWDCVRAADFIWEENEYTRGDPIGLASRRLPFVLPETTRLTFGDIAKRTGRAVSPTL